MDLTSIGLYLESNFISLEEETELLRHLTKEPPKKTKNRNSIQRFGSNLPYNSNMVSKDVPNYFDFLLDRLEEKELVSKRPDSVSVNQYQPGQAITPHIDSKSSGEVITILSLLGDATMIFAKGKQKEKLFFPKRCLVQLKNEIRTEWQHSIDPVSELRYSIVFRISQPLQPK